MKKTIIKAIIVGAVIGLLIGLVNHFVFDSNSGWVLVLVSTIFFSVGQVIWDIASEKRGKPKPWE